MEKSPQIIAIDDETVTSPVKVTESGPIIIIDEIESKSNGKKSPNTKNHLNVPAENVHKHFNFNENLEIKLKEARKERDEAMEDRDRLFTILERRSMEIERLEGDLKMMKEQLQSSIDVKCEALRKFEEVQHKIAETEFKEKRMEQERLLMQNQIEMLSNDLTRNIQELQQCRKESTMRILSLEGKLHEKTEELNISVLHEAQTRETNDMLSAKLEDMSKEILRLNEEFSISMKKYQDELSSKSRLVDLYKDKCEDSLTEQKDITAVVTELRAALKEATEEYGKLETELREKKIQHDSQVTELSMTIESLQNELKNVNLILEAAKRENLEIAVEKLCPSAVTNPKLSKSGHSITEVYSMYVNASEDLDVLSLEHENLKKTFTQVVQEIEDKAPEIQKTQLELLKLRESYQTLHNEYRILKTERLDAQDKIEILMSEIAKSTKKVKDLQVENKDLSSQVCQLLHVIEGRPMLRRISGEFVGKNSVTFSDIRELQENNIKLIGLVRELSAVVEELDGRKIKENEKTDKSDLKITAIQENVEETKITPIVEDSRSDLLQEMQKTKELEEALSNLKSKYEEQMAKKEKALDQVKTQLDEVKNKLSEISATNFKLQSEVAHKESQLKLQQKNFDLNKRKLQSVEDKSRNSAITVAKLETSLAHLRDELQTVANKLSKAEISVVNLTKENKNLTRAEASLRSENEVYKKQQQMHNFMMNSIESIKSLLERNENEKSSKKLAEELEKMSEKCEKLGAALANEKKNFSDFEIQATATIEQLERENQALKDGLVIANDEVEKRIQKISELSKKILTKDEESQSDPESDSEIAKLKENVTQLRKIGKRYKEQYLELKDQLDNFKTENENLKEKISKIQDENSKMTENFENEKTSLKALLTKARGMITSLSEENEELKQQKKLSESQDFVSCIGSAVDLGSTSEQDTTLLTKEPSESDLVKPIGQKRQREEEDDKEGSTEEVEGSEICTKKAKSDDENDIDDKKSPIADEPEKVEEMQVTNEPKSEEEIEDIPKVEEINEEVQKVDENESKNSHNENPSSEIV